MALEQSGPQGIRLKRTTAARTLDPSEKGAVNYFLGLAVCKLFASSLLSAPWLLHLDVFRPQLNSILTGRSRPDLVGQTTGGDWLAFECKGRITPPGEEAKTNAKQQALRLISINGAAPSLHVGSIAYFKGDILNFFWRAPEPPKPVRNPIEQVRVEAATWGLYYAPVLQLLRSDHETFDRMKRQPSLMRIAPADVQIGVHPEVLTELDEGRWEAARDRAGQVAGHTEVTKIPDVGYHADGIIVVPGSSWSHPFADFKGLGG